MDEENDQQVLILHVDENGKAQFPFEHSEGLEVRTLFEEDNDQVKNIKLECLDDVLPEPVCEIEDATADAAGNMIQVEEVLGGMGLGLEQVDAVESMDMATSKDIIKDDLSGDDGEDLVIVQHMDIREPLWKLRKLLEQRLGVDLSACQFWLQNKQMLEPHKNLVDQCVQGEGLVRINVEIKVEHGVHKINVLDILEPDASFEEATEPDDPPSPEKQQVSVSWVQDLKFKKEQEKLGIPADPNLWQPAHVLHWLQWAVRCFNLVGIKLKDWNMTGAELCKLTMQEFQTKVPLDPQELFWTHLEVLRKCKFVAVVQNEEQSQPKGGVRIPAVPPPKSSPPQIRGKLHGKIPRATKLPRTTNIPLGSMESGSSCGNRTGNNGQIQLWQFLLELLTDKDHRSVIQWIGNEGEFKLLNPEMVAQLWGERKNKPTMNYEKLSRALRYYYDGDMISKVQNKRFVYKFVCDLKQLLGYSASELNMLVIEYERKTLGYNPQYPVNAILA